MNTLETDVELNADGSIKLLSPQSSVDRTLILMLGEFGRGPVINKNADREQWARVMSMVAACGGMNH